MKSASRSSSATATSAPAPPAWCRSPARSGAGRTRSRLGQQQRARGAELRHRRHHREHHRQRPCRRPPAAARATAAAAAPAGPARCAASASPWPDFPPRLRIAGQQLVGAEVERAEQHRPVAARHPARGRRSPPARPRRRPRRAPAWRSRCGTGRCRRRRCASSCASSRSRPTFSIRLTRTPSRGHGRAGRAARAQPALAHRCASSARGT